MTQTLQSKALVTYLVIRHSRRVRSGTAPPVPGVERLDWTQKFGMLPTFRLWLRLGLRASDKRLAVNSLSLSKFGNIDQILGKLTRGQVTLPAELGRWVGRKVLKCLPHKVGRCPVKAVGIRRMTGQCGARG